MPDSNSQEPEDSKKSKGKPLKIDPEALNELKEEIIRQAIQEIGDAVPPEIITAAYMRGFDAGFKAGFEKAFSQ